MFSVRAQPHTTTHPYTQLVHAHVQHMHTRSTCVLTPMFVHVLVCVLVLSIKSFTLHFYCCFICSDPMWGGNIFTDSATAHATLLSCSAMKARVSNKGLWNQFKQTHIQAVLAAGLDDAEDVDFDTAVRMQVQYNNDLQPSHDPPSTKRSSAVLDQSDTPQAWLWLFLKLSATT